MRLSREKRKDAILDCKKKWRLKNRDSNLRMTKEWTELNKDRVRERQKKWASENSDRIRSVSKKSRLRLSNYYISKLLSHQIGASINEVNSNPELIQLKRLELALKRKRKEITKK